MTNAKDKVLLSEDPQLLPAYQKVIEFQIGQTRSQINTGFMNNWDDVYASVPIESNMHYRLPGDWDLLDYNGDGVINSFDVVAYGYPQRPENTYNATLGANYKGLSLMVQFFSVTNITLQAPYVTPAQARYTSVASELGNYWNPSNTNADFKAPRLTTTSPTGHFGLYDASFVRLKTAEIAYLLNSSWLRNWGVSHARIALNGNNLLFWSDLPVDRETGSFDIHNAYPMYRQFNLGIEVTF